MKTTAAKDVVIGDAIRDSMSGKWKLVTANIDHRGQRQIETDSGYFIVHEAETFMDLLRKKYGEAIAVKGLFAYSPTTGEEYSASPGDYWDAKPDEPLKDSTGEPMILCRRYATIEVVD